MKKYTGYFLAFILFLSACTYFFIHSFAIKNGIDTWYLLIYFIVLTFLFHYGIVRSTRAKPQVFIRYYMASTTFKLLFHLGIIVIYSIFNRENAVPFILSFMVFYFAFTVFEVAFIWKEVKK
jgi:hypothetical protein